jgi:hypothetical protein
MSQDVFYRSDKNEVAATSQVGANHTLASGERYLTVATQHGGGHRGGRGDENHGKVEIVFFKKTGILGDPRHRLRKNSCRMDANEFIGCLGSSCKSQAEREDENRKSAFHNVPMG